MSLFATLASTLLWFGLLCSSAASTIQYTYDAAGRLTGIDYGNGKITTFGYDDNGNLLKRETESPTNADLTVTKNPSSLIKSGGVDFEYDIIVVNNGPDAASGITMSDTVPFGVGIRSVRSTQGSCSIVGKTITCNLGVLAPTKSATVMIEAFHGFPGSFTNQATAVSAQTDGVPGNDIGTSRTTQNAINNSDSDGMPNWWEEQFGMNPFSSSGNNGPNNDNDGDGVINLHEFFADTDPTDPNDFLKFDDIRIAAPANVDFSTSPIRLYDVDYRSSATNENLYFSLEAGFEGDGLPHTVSDPDGTGTSRIYRLKAIVPAL